MTRKQPARPLRTIGWREWLGLPDMGIPEVKAKVDTGARSSSLHAFNMEFFKRRRVEYVSFNVHPKQRDSKLTRHVEVPVLEHRHIRSSSGHSASRPVIRTRVELFEESWEIDLTLASRDEMGFRMLLGREAIRGRFLVDSEKSFYNCSPPRGIKSRPKK